MSFFKLYIRVVGFCSSILGAGVLSFYLGGPTACMIYIALMLCACITFLLQEL